MNPVHWVRWKLLIGLVVVTGGLACFGVGPLARTAINRAGSLGNGTRWNVDNVHVSLLGGQISVFGLSVSSAGGSVVEQSTSHKSGQSTRQANEFLTAQLVAVDLDMGQLLRRRYCGQLNIKMPTIILQRRHDGSLNIEWGAEVPAAATSDESTPTETRDWWGEIQNYVIKIQQWNEQYHKVADKVAGEEDDQQANESRTAKKSAFRVDYSKRVTYPFHSRPRWVATSLLAEAVQVVFVDNTPAGQARGTIPPLKEGRILIENVSDNPSLCGDPIRWTLTGLIDGAPIKLVGVLDERAGGRAGPRVTSHLELDLQADGLPMEVVQFFVGDSLPVHFDRGTVTLAATATVDNWTELDVRPVFGFREAAVSPLPGTRSIAGVSPDLFCRAFNEVNSLDINDIRVTGTVSQPNVELGDTLTNLVRNGGKAIAKKQIERGVQAARDKIGKAVDAELEKLDAKGQLTPEVGKAVDEVKKGLGDRFKGMPFGEKQGGARKR